LMSDRFQLLVVESMSSTTLVCLCKILLVDWTENEVRVGSH
jgi:hypothetical protein